MKKYLLILALISSSLASAAESGVADQVMRIGGSGGRPKMGSIDLSKSAAVGSTVLGTANGGTGGSALSASSELRNIGLTASVSGNALTIAVKQADASTDCTSTSGCKVGMRSSTITSGAYSQRSITGALSIVVPSSTTIGTTSGVKHTIYVYLIDNAGTLEPAVSLEGSFDEGVLQTSTAVSGGSSAIVLYSTTARSSVAARLIGKVEISEATAGTWATSPTAVSPYPFGRARQVVIGAVQTSNGTTTSVTYADFTNQPTVTFTPQRTKKYKVYGSFNVTTANTGASAFIKIVSSGGTTLATQAALWTSDSVGSYNNMSTYVICSLVAGTSYTFKLQGKIDTSSTLTLLSGTSVDGHYLIAEELD